METNEGADVNILLSHLSSDQRVGRELIHLPITPDREFYGLQTAMGVAGDRGQNEHPIAVGLHDEGKPGDTGNQPLSNQYSEGSPSYDDVLDPYVEVLGNSLRGLIRHSDA